MTERLVEPKGRRPASPVDEVVMSVAIEQQLPVVGPHLPRLLGEFYAEFSKAQTAPVYQIAQEQELPGMGGQFPIFEFGQSEPRYWLISDDDMFLIQIQRDYLAYNWRRRNGSSYVKFEAIRDRFMEIVRTFSKGLQDLGYDFRPLRAELSYINLIHSNEQWETPSDLSRIFRFDIPRLPDADSVSVGTSSSILDADEKWLGRLHVNAQTAFNLMEKKYAVQLTLTSRSADFTGSSLVEMTTFFEEAHSNANTVFREWLTQEAMDEWGLSDDSGKY